LNVISQTDVDRVGTCSRQESTVAYEEEVEASLVHLVGIDRPIVADVDLLDALIGQVAKAGHVGAAGLEPREGLSQEIVRKVVVASQVLILRDFMIHL